MSNEHSRSREQLKRAAAARVRTTMIGAISAVEDDLGFLWGQGKDRRSPGELAMDRLRDRIRTRILDLGNAQIRALCDEIDRHEVAWGRYHVDLPLKSSGEGLNP